MTTVPLTQTQFGMFLEWNADRTSTQYNNCFDNRFPVGTVDGSRLADAVQRVFNAYPVFRMRFAEQDGEVVQFVDEAIVHTVGRRTAREDDMPQVRAEFRRPFDPFSGPMIRAEVVTTESATHLLFDFFHLISDGTTGRIFFDAIAAAYEGRELPREEMSFADYAALEPALFKQDAYRVAKEDHAVRFAGRTMTVPDEGEKAFHRSTSNLQPSTFLIRATAKVPRADVEAFCRAHEVHPNLFFMGAFARTLALYANTTEVVFCTVNHGRRDPRLKSTLGVFIKTVPVLADLRGDLPLAENLKALKLHKAGDYPFTHFCLDHGMKLGLGYVFQDGTVATSLRLGEVSAEQLAFSPLGAGHLPTLLIGGDAQSYELDLSFLPGAYSEGWCNAFVNRIAEVARQFLAHPDAELGEIPTVSDDEAAELVQLARGKDLPYDASATFVDLFRRQVEKSPSAYAVVAANGTFTYTELDAASDAIAADLIARSVKSGEFVAIKLGRVKEFVASAIGIMKAGAGYVPVDPEYPADRIAYMVEDCGAKVVIDDAFLNSNRPAPNTQHSTLNSQHSTLARPEGPAYMIYTSGSTGRPKGVVVPHRALVAFCAWVVDEVSIGAESRMGVTASFSFDASVFDLFPALTAGGEVHVFSDALRKDLAAMRAYAEEKRMTGWTMSTQLGLAMLNAYPDVPLKAMVVGGEKIMPFAKTKVKVYNGYGPTEFTVASSFQIVDQDAPGEVPIGRPVPNSSSFICDRFGQLLPRGMIGELCLAGVQIANGYWHQAEKTKKVFVNGRYHTGDYAMYGEDGLLYYRGRIDSQVKLRGFRIEMGEIEAAMAKFPGIETAVADVKKVNGVDRLVGYYVVGSRVPRDRDVQERAGTRDACPYRVSAEQLREFLAQTLAEYMVPDSFVRLEALPLKPNGKVDRKRLPDPVLADKPIVEPANEVESAILAFVREVLKTDRIGVTHDLARAGLTSLGAMTLAAKLKKECGFAVTLAELAAAATVRGLTACCIPHSACFAALFARGARGRQPLPSTPSPQPRRPRRNFYPIEGCKGVE